MSNTLSQLLNRYAGGISGWNDIAMAMSFQPDIRTRQVASRFTDCMRNYISIYEVYIHSCTLYTQIHFYETLSIERPSVAQLDLGSHNCQGFAGRCPAPRLADLIPSILGTDWNTQELALTNTLIHLFTLYLHAIVWTKDMASYIKIICHLRFDLLKIFINHTSLHSVVLTLYHEIPPAREPC